MKKSSLRIFILLFLLLLIFIRIADLSISSTLNSKSSFIKLTLQRYLSLEVLFERIDFSIINGIKFNNFALKKDLDSILFIRELRVYPSLTQLLQKNIKLNKIFVIDGVTSTDISKYKDYLMSKLEGLINPAKDKSLNGISSLYIRNLKVFLGGLLVSKGFLLINSDMKLYSENLTSKISLDFRGCDLNKSFLKDIFFYKLSDEATVFLQLAFMRENLLINNLVFSIDNLKVIGAGIVYDFKNHPFMDIKFISSPLNLKELFKFKSKLAINGLFNIVANIKGGLSSFLLRTELLMPKGEFYFPKNIFRFNNLFCNIDFKNSQIIIKELSVLVNYRIPLLLTGQISNFANPEFNFTIESHKTNIAEPLIEETTDFVARIKSQLEGNDIIGNANLSVCLSQQLPHYRSKREVMFKLEGLRLSFNREVILENLKHCGLDFTSGKLLIINKETLNDQIKNEQNLEVDNFKARFLLSQDALIKTQMHCSGYNGVADGRGQWDLSNKNPNNYLVIKFTDLSINSLKAIYPTSADISGLLNGWFYFRNDKTAFLEGALGIKNASIAKFNLLNNIADFLRVKSLKELKDIFLFTNFAINKSGTVVKRFSLYNDNLNLQAKLDMNNRGWLNGTVSLILSRNILEESNIFRTLLSMIKEKQENIDFDFKVSGFSNALRIELLEGEFRNKLMKKLGGGIRSQIENEINKALGYFHEKGSP